MRSIFVNGFYSCKHIIENMLSEGYTVKEISIEGKLVKGEEIKYIDFFDYVCIEFESGDVLFISYEKINYIGLKEDDED